MSWSLPIELRKRIVSAHEQGLSGRAIARLFSVGHGTVHRYLQKVNNGESLEPKRPPGATPKLGSQEKGWLKARLAKDPYLTSYEVSAQYNAAHAKNRVHRSTILRAMHDLGFTHKKRRR